MLRSHTELIEEVSRNLRPAPPICKAAAAIVTQLTARGAAFNGVHLRVEADANFQTYVDGDEVRRLTGLGSALGDELGVSRGPGCEWGCQGQVAQPCLMWVGYVSTSSCAVQRAAHL